MLAHYGVDVLDPQVSPRRIWVLARRLPAGVWPDPDSPMSWSMETHLLAHVLDQLAALTYVTLKANSKKGASIPAPKPFPRPKAPRQAPPAKRGTGGGWAALAAALTGQPGVTVHRHG